MPRDTRTLPRRLLLGLTAGVMLALSPMLAGEETHEFPEPHNSQELTSALLAPSEALAALRVPEGFGVSLFAAEPHVQQPIAIAFDGAGRVWVAENYTYAEQQLNHDLTLHDRILVLEDQDGDGQFDQRHVFWDQAQRLTSVEVGFGGVWALCPPALLFIPDKNADLIPDGPPQVILDGWSEDASRHNFVNGLRWGPDGWLYGRHGIMDTSRVGPPGTPEDQRTLINCGIWRFHPVTHQFEVVCHGTTNSWGMDWDDYGEPFFINTVIGHLWHAIPGAHFERMYGEDFRTHLYQLIPQTADHYHWDTAEAWNDVQKGLSLSSSRQGGGHAHCGMMIYLGDNWPAHFRNDVFTLNLHGRRINRDTLIRRGATYVGEHQPDVLHSDDIWFRGIELTYGPDGAVYILDWSDLGECHENDGVHRTSGRIFKVRWKEAAAQAAFAALDSQTDAQLVQLQLHDNDWFVRQSRRILQERAANGRDLHAARRELQQILVSASDVRKQLRALWALHVTGGVPHDTLSSYLEAENEHLRVWAIRLLIEQGLDEAATAKRLVELAQREDSGLVLTYLASALQRCDSTRRWPLALALVKKSPFAGDSVLPLMIWYGIEPAVVQHTESALTLARDSRTALLAEFISRRISYEWERHPEGVNQLVETLIRVEDHAYRTSILRGMAHALRGRRRAAVPPSWSAAEEALRAEGTAEVVSLVRTINVVFGDGRAVIDLKGILADAEEEPETRRQALQALVSSRAEGLAELAQTLLNDREIGPDAVRALAMLQDADTTDLLLQALPRMHRLIRVAAIETLAARLESASRLIDAVATGDVPRNEIPPFLLRQMQLFGDEPLQQAIDRLWPEQRLIAGDKLEFVNRIRGLLTSSELASGHLERGQAVYKKSCANCHKLFGEGGTLGPELTGGQRNNLNYWLENLVDPSASVAANFRMSVVILDDGRIITGVVGERTDQTLSVQTPTEKIVLDRETILEIRATQLSLMPDGLLATLSAEEIRDLFAYLMK